MVIVDQVDGDQEEREKERLSAAGSSRSWGLAPGSQRARRDLLTHQQ